MAKQKDPIEEFESLPDAQKERIWQELESNPTDLSERLAQGRYRARPVKRGIRAQSGRQTATHRHPRAGGQDRPAGNRAGSERRLRDRLPGLLVRLPPKRSAHMALDALAVGIRTRKVAARWLPMPRVYQPYPEQRPAVFIQGKSPAR